MLGLLFPLDEESRPFKASINDQKPILRGKHQFIEGTYHGTLLAAAITGMGKVSAAMRAQALIDYYSPRLLLLAGVAGCLTDEMMPGDIFIASEICQHDVYAPSKGTKWRDYRHHGQGIFLGDEGLHSTALALDWDKSNVFTGRLLTGDKAVATKDYTKKLIDKLKGKAVDMESAAVAQVAAYNDIPLLVVRVISDNANENAMKDFQANFSNACQLLGEYLELLLGKLIEKEL
ncbi:5'-methylthioadenosine/S-adenosylhomocysteine nucleosidase [Metallumcola ferriviriculae]|uniref:adenosylhomocysteine nucleosidase n=1 Tax=Metallumcola ferriviriculae TaxID=3039180 RepID=A0AAU0UNI5_9FIRM|nr:5'-methylthioadenosine/S-adenosylhomocysteine nucleosidase [Desulfitibacteraceae bacterium MK1]